MKLPVIALAAVMLGMPLVAQQAGSVFRSTTQRVFVDVAVKKGNVPVRGLRADEFQLLDNGVKQDVTAIAMESVPIDISVFMDISASTSEEQPEMQRILRDTVRMLRPDDRFRVLTTGLGIRQLVGWTDAGAPIEFPDPGTVADISLVYDGVFAAAAHRPAVGRRHLVLALTDGEDDCSLVRADELRRLAGRTESVVHWIPRGGGPLPREHLTPPPASTTARGTCPSLPTKDTFPLSEFVNSTGGVVHDGIVESLLGNIFERIISDYRQSYVLQYEPRGVEQTGWHALEVDVVTGKYTVRARRGYDGG
jgi:hypothetical protein